MTINHEINILLSQLCLICLFLKPISKGSTCLVLCHSFWIPSQSPVFLTKSPSLTHFLRGWAHESFVQGRRKGSFITADLSRRSPVLNGVSGRKKMWKEAALWEKDYYYILVRYQISTSPICTFVYEDVGNKPLYLRAVMSVNSARVSHNFSSCRAAVHNLQPLL